MKKTAARWGAASLSSIILFTQVVFSPAWVEAAQVDFWKSRAQMRASALVSAPSITSSQSFPFLNASIAHLGLLNSRPQGHGTRPTIVLLQDVHHNVEAQRNIGEILKRTQNVVIGVEAANGAFNFAPFHSFPVPSAAKNIGDYLLAQNIISGASWAGLTAENKLSSMVGVDDSQLYADNILAYQKAAPHQDTVLREIEARYVSLEKSFETLTPAAQNLFASLRAFHRGENTIEDYLAALNVLDFNGAPNAHAFSRALKMEKTLDLAAAEQERDRLMAEMAHRDGKTVQKLAQTAQLVAAGQISPLELYGQLSVDQKKYPALHAYVRYLTLADSIDRGNLFIELASLRNRAVEGIAAKSDKAILKSLVATMLAEKLAKFELTPEEWAEYKTLTPTPLPGGEGLGERGFADFYHLAESRNEKMAENLLAAMAREKKKTGVLVAGGFHTAGLTPLFKQKGFEVIVVTPKFDTSFSGSGSDYLKTFLRQTTPLAQLFAGEKLTLGDQAQHINTGGTTLSNGTRTALILAAAFIASANVAPARAQQALQGITPAVESVQALSNNHMQMNVGGQTLDIRSNYNSRAGITYPNVPVVGNVNVQSESNTAGLIATVIALWAALNPGAVLSALGRIFRPVPHSIDGAVKIIEQNTFFGVNNAVDFVLANEQSIKDPQIYVRLMKAFDSRFYLFAPRVADLLVTEQGKIFMRATNNPALLKTVLYKLWFWNRIDNATYTDTVINMRLTWWSYIAAFFKSAPAKNWLILFVPFLMGAKANGPANPYAWLMAGLFAMPVIFAMAADNQTLQVVKKGGGYVLGAPKRFVEALAKIKKTKATVKQPFNLNVDGRVVPVASLVIEQVGNDIVVLNPIPEPQASDSVPSSGNAEIDALMDLWSAERQDVPEPAPPAPANVRESEPAPNSNVKGAKPLTTGIDKKPHVKPGLQAEQALYYLLSQVKSVHAQSILETVAEEKDDGQKYPTLHVLINLLFQHHVHQENIDAQAWLPSFFSQIRSHDSLLSMDTKTYKDAMGFVEQVESEKRRIDALGSGPSVAKVLLPFIPFFLLTQMGAAAPDAALNPLVAALFLALTIAPIAMAVAGQGKPVEPNAEATVDGYVLKDKGGQYMKALLNHPKVALRDEFTAGREIPVTAKLLLNFGNIKIVVTTLIVKKVGDRLIITGASNDSTNVMSKFPPLPAKPVAPAPAEQGVLLLLERDVDNKLVLVTDNFTGPISRLAEDDVRRVKFFAHEEISFPGRRAQLQYLQTTITADFITVRLKENGRVAITDALMGREPVLGDLLIMGTGSAHGSLSEDEAFNMIMGNEAQASAIVMDDNDDGDVVLGRDSGKTETKEAAAPQASDQPAARTQASRPVSRLAAGQPIQVVLFVDKNTEEVMRYLLETQPRERQELVQVFFGYVSKLTQAKKIKADFPLSRALAYMYLHHSSTKDGQRVQSFINDLFRKIQDGDISLADDKTLLTARAYIRPLTKAKPLVSLFFAAFIVFTQVAAASPTGQISYGPLGMVLMAFSMAIVGMVAHNRGSHYENEDWGRVYGLIQTLLRGYGRNITNRVSLEEALRAQMKSRPTSMYKVDFASPRLAAYLDRLEVEYADFRVASGAFIRPSVQKLYREIIRTYWETVFSGKEAKFDYDKIMMKNLVGWKTRRDQIKDVLKAHPNDIETLRINSPQFSNALDAYLIRSNLAKDFPRSRPYNPVAQNIPTRQYVWQRAQAQRVFYVRAPEADNILGQQLEEELVSDHDFDRYLTRLIHNSQSNLKFGLDGEKGDVTVKYDFEVQDGFVVGIKDSRIRINPKSRDKDKYSLLLTGLFEALVVSDLIAEAKLNRDDWTKLAASPYVRWRALTRLAVYEMQASGWTIQKINGIFGKIRNTKVRLEDYAWLNSRPIYSTIEKDVQETFVFDPEDWQDIFGPMFGRMAEVKTMSITELSLWRYLNTLSPYLLLIAATPLLMGANGGNVWLSFLALAAVAGIAIGIGSLVGKFFAKEKRSSDAVALPLATFALQEWRNERSSLVATNTLSVHNIAEVEAMLEEAIRSGNAGRLAVLKKRLAEIGRQIEAANDGRGAVMLVGIDNLRDLRDVMARAKVENFLLGLGGVKFSEEKIGDPMNILEENKGSFEKVKIYALESSYWAFDKATYGRLSADEVGQLIVEMMNWEQSASVDVTKAVLGALQSLRAA